MTSIIDGPRACTPGELAEMIALVDGVMRAGTGQSMLTDVPLVYRDENLHNVQIIKASGRIVSVVPFIPHNVEIDGCRFTIGIISPTATHPEHRRKGYALRCLNRCLEIMEREGIDLSVLWTEVPTFEFYRHAEYQAIPEQHGTYTLTSNDAARFAAGADQIEVLDVSSEADLEAIRKLHEQEIFGVRRPAGNYAVLFSLPRMTTLLARRNGHVAAYLVVSRAFNKPGLIEAGGDESAIRSLIHHALSQLPDGQTIVALVNDCPQALARALQRLARRQTARAAGHEMIRINRPAEFLQKISPRIGETSAAKLATSGLSRGALTAAIFGAHPQTPINVPKELQADPLFDFSIWMLDHS